MAQFSRMEVASAMKETGLVPLFYCPNIETGKKVLKACYKGGARLIEYTARDDFAHKVFRELVDFSKSELPNMIIGVGSVTGSTAASWYIQIGANFVVSPSLREDIAIVCNRSKVMYLPGCGSLTEIGKAEELGCEVVKLFPGDVYGPEFIKAIQGPQPWTSIMATGGVSPTMESLKDWFGAGVFCVGMGSKLIRKNKQGKYDLPKIENLVRFSIESIEQLKN